MGQREERTGAASRRPIDSRPNLYDALEEHWRRRAHRRYLAAFLALAAVAFLLDAANALGVF